MFTRFRHRRAPVALVILALAAALTLSGCGSFDSKASGENLIKKWVPDKLDKVSGQPIKLSSVNCPSGVKDTVGNTYDCKLTLENSTRSGGRRVTGALGRELRPGAVA